MSDLGEDTVDPSAHSDRSFPRLDMQITGAESNGILQEAIDQDDDLDALSDNTFRLEVMNGVTHCSGRILAISLAIASAV